MFDFDLHMRFVRSSTDAFFEMGKASLAAAEAWQREAAQASPATFASRARPVGTPLAGMENWSKAWTWWLESAAAASAPVPDFWRGSRYSQSPQQSIPAFGWPWVVPGWPAHMMNATTGSPAQSAYMAQMFPFAWTMRMVPWSFYQGPMIGMMLSAGMPYAVAAPSARAGTSAMDAVDAAQKQWQNVFAAYHSDGGYASSHN